MSPQVAYCRSSSATPRDWRCDPRCGGRWSEVTEVLDEMAAALEEGRDPFYTNELGVRARADDVTTLDEVCRVAGLSLVAHYGVRIASDHVPVDAAARSPEDVEPLVEVEVRLG
jgi:S-adenosylmethionine-dependent methyltransferase